MTLWGGGGGGGGGGSGKGGGGANVTTLFVRNSLEMPPKQ